MKIGKYDFDVDNNTYVMGILNVTPDSFSDGGKFANPDLALRQVDNMIEEGAAIIDIGGESTRPGYVQISDDEEIDRVVPVIEAIKNRFDIPVSLDTYKYKVALEGIRSGADMINDIWGLKCDDGQMAKVIADSHVACCLMHNRNDSDYSSFLNDVLNDIGETLAIAESNGIDRDKIILDPGIGFGKTYENNLQILNNLDVFNKFKLPILLGASRKSVIGLTLDVPPSERVIGTCATTVFAVLARCAFVRVHDVRANVQAIKMARAIINS